MVLQFSRGTYHKPSPQKPEDSDPYGQTYYDSDIEEESVCGEIAFLESIGDITQNSGCNQLQGISNQDKEDSEYVHPFVFFDKRE